MSKKYEVTREKHLTNDKLTSDVIFIIKHGTFGDIMRIPVEQAKEVAEAILAKLETP